MPNLQDLSWMLLPFLACLVLSINHVYLGIHVLARKVIFVDLALAQIAALGATYALILGYDPAEDALKISAFSLAFTFVGAGAFAIARMRKEKVPQEAFIGIIYAAASAAAILILSKSATGGEELKHMLVGDVLLVSRKAVLEMTLGYGAIGLFHFIFRRKFLAISLDHEAASAHMNVRIWDILFYMSFGLVITKSVEVVGVLLVFSYLVVPAVIAQMWSDSIRGRLLLGWLMAILASTVGIFWSFYADYPTGPAVVVTLGIFLILSSVVYYVLHSPARLRAAANVAGMVLFAIAFFASLSLFKKEIPAAESGGDAVQHLLQDLKSDDEAHQLGSLEHLGDIKDPRIVPALSEFLSSTTSGQAVEAAVAALARQGNPTAIPALRKSAAQDYDGFLKLSIADAQLTLGDAQGFSTLIALLKNDEEGFARMQAIDLLQARSGRDFGYDAEKSVAENAEALKRIDQWFAEEGDRLKLDPAKKVFAARQEEQSG
jgi:zinc/manganese transport system permease protein